MIDLTILALAADSNPSNVDLPSAAAWLAYRLGTSTFVGGILLSAIVMGIFVFPILYLTKGRDMMTPTIMGIIISIFCVTIGWLPQVTIILIIVMIGLMLAGRMRDWITGRGTG